MSIISKMRKQTAVLWVRGTSPGEFGEYTYEEPVEIECRWDDEAREFLSPTGETLTSSSVVYPDRDVQVGDFLMEGEIDSNTPDDPTEYPDAKKVRGKAKTPNLRATETLYTAYL